MLFFEFNIFYNTSAMNNKSNNVAFIPKGQAHQPLPYHSTLLSLHRLAPATLRRAQS